MTHEEFRSCIYDDLLPMVRVLRPAALHALMDDFCALESAFTSGDSTRVDEIVNHISEINGLLNGILIAKLIKEKL